MRASAAALILLTLLALGGCVTRPPPTLPEPAPPIAPQPPPKTPRDVFVETALSVQGTPYRYGGSGPDAFDCSGLVDYAARRAGIIVPRTAAEQFRTGTVVKRDALQAGDLVFMRLKRELHVGIMVSPDRFVHAPSSGGRVRIDQLDAAPYARAYKGARRLSP